jgi:hypothetical protein
MKKSSFQQLIIASLLAFTSATNLFASQEGLQEENSQSRPRTPSLWDNLSFPARATKFFTIEAAKGVKYFTEEAFSIASTVLPASTSLVYSYFSASKGLETNASNATEDISYHLGGATGNSYGKSLKCIEKCLLQASIESAWGNGTMGWIAQRLPIGQLGTVAALTKGVWPEEMSVKAFSKSAFKSAGVLAGFYTGGFWGAIAGFAMSKFTSDVVPDSIHWVRKAYAAYQNEFRN